MRISYLRFGFVLAALISIVFHDVLLGTSSFFYRDFGLFGYPLAHYHRTSFWNGEIPLWNPYSNSGHPFLAQWNTMVFYPFSVIYLILPLPWSLNAFCLFHLWLAGVAMFLLARHWSENDWAAAIAGIGYSCCGLLQHSLMWPNNIAALALMPFVVLMVELAIEKGGRFLIWAPLIASAQFLAGAPEVFLFTWMLVCALWTYRMRGIWRRQSSARLIWKRVLSRGFYIAIAVLGLTALQWIPLVDLLIHSHRDSEFATGVWSMPIWGIANFLIPLFHCTPSLAGVYSQDAQQWTSTYYSGVGILWLALCGIMEWRKSPTVAVLGGISVFSLFMAFGDAGLIYTLFKAYFPFLGLVRYPIKFVIVLTWCLPLLAAHGAAVLLAYPEYQKRIMSTWGLGLAASIVVLLAVVRQFPFPGEEWSITWQNGLSRLCLLAGVILTIVVLRNARFIGWWRCVCWIGLLLVALDGLTHTPTPNPTVNARSMKSHVDSEAPKLALGQGRSMISPKMRSFLANAGNPNSEAVVTGHRDALYPNWNLLNQSPMVNGFFSLYLKEAHDIESVLYSAGEKYPESLADFLGVHWISSADTLFTWQRRQRAHPLVKIGMRPEFVDEKACLESLAQSSVDLNKVVLLPRKYENRDSQSLPTSANILRTLWSTQSVKIEYAARKKSWLVIAQTYHPNWKAYIEGRQIPVVRANHAFQAVEVPRGHHEIILRYRDKGFEIGVIISILSLVGVALTFFQTASNTQLRKQTGSEPE